MMKNDDNDDANDYIKSDNDDDNNDVKSDNDDIKCDNDNDNDDMSTKLRIFLIYEQEKSAWNDDKT